MPRTKAYPKQLSGGAPVKVPVVMQMEALECGAACVGMILAYFGKWIPLSQLRTECGVSSEGTKIKHMLRCCRSHGMTTKIMKYEPDYLAKKGSWPCIIHWNFNHFVVLDGFKNGRAYINDPAKGRYSVSMGEFDEAFTGITLLIQPGPDFQPSGKPKSVWPFIRKRMQGSGAAFSLVVLTTIAVSLIGIVMPGVSRVFTDRILTGQSPEWFPVIIQTFALVAAIQIVVEMINAVFSLKLNGKLAIIGNAEYVWHVLRLPVEFFQQRYVGDISERQEHNASIANTLISTFAPLLIQAAMLVFYLVVMVRYSWVMALLGVASVVFSFCFSYFSSKKRLDVTRVNQKDGSNLYSSTVVAAQMIDTIKASGAEDGYFEKWSGHQASKVRSDKALADLSLAWGLAGSVVSKLFEIAILAGGVLLCIDGQWTVGMITAFVGYLASFTAPAQKLIGATSATQLMYSDMERIEDVMTYPVSEKADESFDVDAVEPYAKLTGKLELRDVTFGYAKLDEPLITNLNLTLEPGQSIALVGPSGCGKSTIAKLISGLYDAWSGEILFDGVPIQRVSNEILRSSVAVVDQSITLFADSIGDNIRMWDDSIPSEQVTRAAKDAQIHDDIMSRPGSYRDLLVEGGRNLSGGQRQRIEIARALVQAPSIIVMDEATSALDAQTEAKVVQAVKDRGITCVVVAHRLSTIRDCDQVLVLDHGTVVEQGTHEQLYAAGGMYAALVGSEEA